MKRIGVLTGGGDCAGLNAVIRGIVVTASKYGYETLGFKLGWAGAMKGDMQPLNLDIVEDILSEGGTMLGTSRVNPFKTSDGPQKVIDSLERLGIDALIAIGGDDTLGVALKLHEMGVPVVGVPKTIDNDLSATDYSLGFITAINVAMEAIGRLHTTARSHRRVFVVEIMGRYAGWITLMAGLAGGAHMILIPEVPFSFNDVCGMIKRRRETGKLYTIVAVAEGAIPIEREELIALGREVDEFGHLRLGGIAEALADVIKKRTGAETRHVVLGHVQRGGSPTAFDRILGIRLGVKAVELVKEGKLGQMASLRGTDIVSVGLEEAVKEPKLVGKELYEIAKLFFG